MLQQWLSTCCNNLRFKPPAACVAIISNVIYLIIYATLQEISKPSRLVTSAPVSQWRTGPPDSPPFVGPQGQSCASGRASSTTPSTLWWGWSTTPTSGRKHWCSPGLFLFCAATSSSSSSSFKNSFSQRETGHDFCCCSFGQDRFSVS